MAVHWRRILVVGLSLFSLWSASAPARADSDRVPGPPDAVAGPAPEDVLLGPAPAAEGWRELPPTRALAVTPLSRFLSPLPGIPAGARFLLDPRTGLPRMLYDFADRARGLPSIAAANGFLAEHRSLLLGDGTLDDLRLLDVRLRPGSRHVRFEQQLGGLPVWGGGLSVHMDEDGRVLMVNGTFFPDVRIDALPRLDPAEAAQRAMDAVHDDHPATDDDGGEPGLDPQAPLLGPPSVELGIYPRLRVYRLAYRVRFAAARPADWECFVDAATGAVLACLERGREADGSGLVVEQNPWVTPGVVTRPFPYLAGDGSLRGLFADVWVFDQYDQGSVLRRRNAHSPTGVFDASSDQPQFDEQMLYFHVNRVHDWYKEHFNFTGRDAPLAVHAHWPTIGSGGRVLPYNNAYYSPAQQGLYFGDGTGSARGGLNSLARDADVIYHEYTHAVIDRITALGRWPNDFGTALNEAFADYFSGTITGNPAEGEYASGRSTGIRTLASVNRFPRDANLPSWGLPEAHYTGLIWGASCWDLRDRLGAEVADRILFESLHFLPSDGSADYPVALAAVLQADQTVYKGEHLDAIREVFRQRGIEEPQRGYVTPVAITVSVGGRLVSAGFAAHDRLLLLAEDAGPQGAAGSYDLTDLRFDLNGGSTSPRRLTVAGTGTGRRVIYDPQARRAVVGDSGGSYRFVDLPRGGVSGASFGSPGAVSAIAVQPLAARVYFGIDAPGRLETLSRDRRLTPLTPSARFDGINVGIRDLATDLVNNRLVVTVDDSDAATPGLDRLEVRDSRTGALRSEWLATTLGIADVGQVALDERQGLAFVADNVTDRVQRGEPAPRAVVIVDLKNGTRVDRIEVGPSVVTDLAYDADLGVLLVSRASPAGYTLIDVATRRTVPFSLDSNVTAAAFETITHTAALATADGRLLLIPFRRPSA